MKKINLLKSLAILGAVTLTSVCVAETALLLHKNIGPENSDPINLADYNGYTLVSELVGIYNPSEIEIKELLVKDGIKSNPSSQTIIKLSDKEDININIDGAHQQFIVTAVGNSGTYVSNSQATISYALPETVELSSIIGSTPTAYIDEHWDQELTKANILKSLQTQYPGLNVNHLNVTLTGYAEVGTATISAKTNSTLYSGNEVGVTYYTSGSVSMVADKYVIAGVTSNNVATFTFNFKGSAVTATYTALSTLPSILTLSSSGTLTYTVGSATDFVGGAYAIQGSYLSGGNTYISRVVIYAQPNIQTGTLTFSKPNIKIGNLNSGTTTMRVDGNVVSGSTVSYTCDYNGVAITGTANDEGLSFNTTTGVLSWANNAPTYGGLCIITGTYQGTGIKTAVATNYVNVIRSTDATLAVTNHNINNATTTSGAVTLQINGTTQTATSWAVTGGLTSSANAEGLSFSTGIITWDGKTKTNGGEYKITATYKRGTNGVTVTAWTMVYVVANRDSAIRYIGSEWQALSGNTYTDMSNNNRSINIYSFGIAKSAYYIYLGNVNPYNMGTIRLTGRYLYTSTDVQLYWAADNDAPSVKAGAIKGDLSVLGDVGFGHGSGGQLWMKYSVSDPGINNLKINMEVSAIGGSPSLQYDAPAINFQLIPRTTYTT